MSKKLAMSKDAPLSKEMMKIVRMRLMGLRMTSPPKVETVKPKVLNVWPFYPLHPTLSYFECQGKYSFWHGPLFLLKLFLFLSLSSFLTRLTQQPQTPL